MPPLRANSLGSFGRLASIEGCKTFLRRLPGLVGTSVHRQGFLILRFGLIDLPFVYLGYWVSGSEKMDYKSRFRPLEVLKPGGWVRLSEKERSSGQVSR